MDVPSKCTIVRDYRVGTACRLKVHVMVGGRDGRQRSMQRSKHTKERLYSISVKKALCVYRP